MDDREQRGLALAALYRIEQVDGKWLVPSQSGNGTKYVVDPEKRHCTCRDHEDRAIKCKHMFAAEVVQTRETSPDGTETVTRTFKVTEKVTYKQDWPNYNKAQTCEKRKFLAILSDLCRGVTEPPANPQGGRPRHPLADIVFSIVYKVYAAVSARRFTCDLEDAATQGFIRKAPHYNVVCYNMDDAALTPILKALIVESSKPLAAVETDFAVDSSGFSTSRFVRWFDIKYGKTMEEREWVKVHVACGVQTNVVTAVEILGKNANDAPVLGPLVRQTRENFTMKEVSGDAIYATQDNFEAIAKAGAAPYLAFKDNATGGVGGLFARAFHYYRAFRDDFLAHYHKRSNVESTFSMVKAKFGDAVRSKGDVAMLNEVLYKILCHNICCLVQSMFELGIEATFWGKEEAQTEAEPDPAGDDLIGAWAWV